MEHRSVLTFSTLFVSYEPVFTLCSGDTKGPVPTWCLHMRACASRSAGVGLSTCQPVILFRRVGPGRVPPFIQEASGSGWFSPGRARLQLRSASRVQAAAA